MKTFWNKLETQTKKWMAVRNCNKVVFQVWQRSQENEKIYIPISYGLARVDRVKKIWERFEVPFPQWKGYEHDFKIVITADEEQKRMIKKLEGVWLQ